MTLIEYAHRSEKRLKRGLWLDRIWLIAVLGMVVLNAVTLPAFFDTERFGDRLLIVALWALLAGHAWLQTKISKKRWELEGHIVKDLEARQ